MILIVKMLYFEYLHSSCPYSEHSPLWRLAVLGQVPLWVVRSLAEVTLSLRTSALSPKLLSGWHPCQDPWHPYKCELLKTGSLHTQDVVQVNYGCHGPTHKKTVSELRATPLSEDYMREQSFCT